MQHLRGTRRPVCVRMKGQLDGNGKTRQNSPLAEHTLQKNYWGNRCLEVVILAHNSKISTHKYFEALPIKAENLKMNRKEECLEIARDITLSRRNVFDMGWCNECLFKAHMTASPQVGSLDETVSNCRKLLMLLSIRISDKQIAINQIFSGSEKAITPKI